MPVPVPRVVPGKIHVVPKPIVHLHVVPHMRVADGQHTGDVQHVKNYLEGLGVPLADRLILVLKHAAICAVGHYEHHAGRGRIQRRIVIAGAPGKDIVDPLHPAVHVLLCPRCAGYAPGLVHHALVHGVLLAVIGHGKANGEGADIIPPGGVIAPEAIVMGDGAVQPEKVRPVVPQCPYGRVHVILYVLIGLHPAARGVEAPTRDISADRRAGDALYVELHFAVRVGYPAPGQVLQAVVNGLLPGAQGIVQAARAVCRPLIAPDVYRLALVYVQGLGHVRGGRGSLRRAGPDRLTEDQQHCKHKGQKSAIFRFHSSFLQQL